MFRRMIVFVLIGMFAVSPSVSVQAQSFKRKMGLSKDREFINLPRNQKLMAERIHDVTNAREFWLLRHPDAKEAWKRGHDPKLQALVKASAAAWSDVKPEVLNRVMFVESYFRPDVRSGTGPAGIAQLSRGAVQDYNRTVVRDRRLNTSRNSDDRMNPAKALPVMAWYVHNLMQTFGGSEDLAVQAYHDGPGRMLNSISFYTGIPKAEVTTKSAAKIVADRKLTWPLMFFHNTPYFKEAAYEYMRTAPDFGSTYYFSNVKAGELLNLTQAAYEKRADDYANRFRSSAAPNRMWVLYTPQQIRQMKFADLMAIQSATQSANHDGRLAPVPQPYAYYGLAPRLSGKSRIGEKDPANQKWYVAAEKSTIACMIYIMSELKYLQGESFRPYEINSLVRSDEYQRRLGGTNSNAKTDLPTHTIGKAFDIPIGTMSADRIRDLQFVLTDMDYSGMIAFVREGRQKTFHVIPHPQWTQFFMTVYRQTVEAKPKSTK